LLISIGHRIDWGGAKKLKSRKGVAKAEVNTLGTGKRGGNMGNIAILCRMLFGSKRR